MTPAEGAGRRPSRSSRESGDEDPRGVLLSVDQLVVAAGDSIRRLRHVQSVSRGLGDEWPDDRSLEEMVARLDDVRGRLMHLRAEARKPAAGPKGGVQTPPHDRAD